MRNPDRSFFGIIADLIKKVCLIHLLLLITFSVSVHAQDKKKSVKPNVLLIICDQLRYDCQGRINPIVNTPNLDKLAAQGMFFNNAFTPIPTCCPARESLFSGLWPAQHKGLWNYDITLPVAPFDSHTWTEDLKDDGYLLGYIGKWHVSAKKTPIDFGFDDYVSDEQYPIWRNRQNLPEVVPVIKNNTWMGGVDPAPLGKQHTHWLAGKAIRLIKKYHKAGKPWNMVLSFREPHLPCNPSKRFLEMYDTSAIKPWKNFSDSLIHKPYIQKQQLYNWGIEDYTWKQWAVYVKHYYAMISQTDDAIGKVLDFLNQIGIEKNTVVIFTADHGDMAGAHGMIDKHYVMYDEVVHVPLVIKWDGVIEPDNECNKFVINGLDLSATIPAIAGFKFMQSKGRSLLPLLEGKRPVSWRKFAFSNYNGAQFGLYVERMIRNNHWKYIWNLTDIDELYNLKKDPQEMTNLISVPKYKDTLRYLKRKLYISLKARHDPIVNWAGKPQLLEEERRK